MPTSSIGRFSSYSLYSSYPSSYRTSSAGSPSSSSYLNRTTSLDRSAYGSSSIGSGSSTGSGSSYYRYSGASKGLSALPPRPTYSSASDTYRSSRSVRASPSRSSYSSRLSDAGIDRESRNSFSKFSRDYSASRDSGYGSLYTSRDRSVDYSNANGDYSRRSSLYRRDSDYDDEASKIERIRVNERIRAYEGRRDPVEERLAQRRKRLGLSPTRDSGSRSPRPPTYQSRVDNRRRAEENGNDSGEERRTSVTDLCRKYSSNLNLTNGESAALSEVSGCSGGAGPLASQKDSILTVRPASPINIKSTRPRLDSYGKDEKDSPIGSPKTSSYSRAKSPVPKEPESPKATSIRNDASSSRSTYTLPFRSKDRREKMKERIALRLSTEIEDGDSPPSRRRSPTGSSSESFSESNGLVGLRNIGNTCFMNSITQCLSNTKCLQQYMVCENYTSDINTTLSTMKGDLVRAFGSLLNEMWREGSSSSPVNTGSFKSQIQRFAPTFIGYAQHDAQEFLRKLLEGLHEDVNRVTVRPRPITEDIDEMLDDNQKAMEAWKRYLRYDDSKIVDMFVGQLKSSLLCSVCSHRSVTFDPFWDLSLPIPSRVGQVKLSNCLDLFTKEEVMDGDERPTCSKCKERRKMTKSFSIHKFPKVLVLHLKRFSPNERWRGKLACMVDFALDNLDLSKYASSPSISCQYRLTSVANHSGTALSGHYTAYCRHPYLKTWHEYNDSRVSSISSNRVCSAEAYVLFYELSSY